MCVDLETLEKKPSASAELVLYEAGLESPLSDLVTSKKARGGVSVWSVLLTELMHLKSGLTTAD